MEGGGGEDQYPTTYPYNNCDPFPNSYDTFLSLLIQSPMSIFVYTSSQSSFLTCSSCCMASTASTSLTAPGHSGSILLLFCHLLHQFYNSLIIFFGLLCNKLILQLSTNPPLLSNSNLLFKTSLFPLPCSTILS